MESIITLLVPVIITLMTNGIKKMQTIEISDNRKAIIRLVVAVLSFVGSVGTVIVTGGQVDESISQILVQSVFTFLGSTGLYTVTKK